VIVIMGATGTGKTTIALMLSEALGWRYCEADEHHSPGNVAKMADGHPLTDEDRLPWLYSISEWVQATTREGSDSVIACSSLRRGYRDILRRGVPRLDFVHLAAPEAVLRRRLSDRRDHFMPASLVCSQLATLEPLGPDESGITVDAQEPPEAILGAIVERLLERTEGRRVCPPTRPLHISQGRSV
jgi:gluconokinase